MFTYSPQQVTDFVMGIFLVALVVAMASEFWPLLGLIMWGMGLVDERPMQPEPTEAEEEKMENRKDGIFCLIFLLNPGGLWTLAKSFLRRDKSDQNEPGEKS